MINFNKDIITIKNKTYYKIQNRWWEIYDIIDEEYYMNYTKFKIQAPNIKKEVSIDQISLRYNRLNKIKNILDNISMQ